MTMNPEAASSAGLHLFQELSTLGQQFAHPLLLGSGLGKIKPMFPARPPRPRQPFGGARSSTGAAVHTEPSIVGNCRAFIALLCRILTRTSCFDSIRATLLSCSPLKQKHLLGFVW